MGTAGAAGSGLCASLWLPRRAERDPPAAVLVHAGEVVARRNFASVAELARPGAWLPLELRIDSEGVSLAHNGAHLLRRVSLRRPWVPAAHWRLALVGLTRAVPGAPFWVDNLRVRATQLAKPPALASATLEPLPTLRPDPEPHSQPQPTTLTSVPPR